MKRTLPLALLILSSAILSCNRDHEIPAQHSPQSTALLDKVDEVYTRDGLTDTTIEYTMTYDDQQRVIGLHEFGVGEIRGVDSTLGINLFYKYHYNAAEPWPQLVTKTGYDPRGSFTFSDSVFYRYENDRVVIDSGLTWWSGYMVQAFQLSQNNLHLEYRSQDGNQNGLPTGDANVSFVNGNLTTFETENWPALNYYYYSADYNEHPNPFYRLSPPVTFRDNNSMVYPLIGQPSLTTTERLGRSAGDIRSTRTIEYTYREDGYPLTAKIHDSGVPLIVTYLYVYQ